MIEERHVSLFRSGRNQAVRIPPKFEMEGTEAIMHKEGKWLIIEPVPPRNKLLRLLAGWEPMDEDIAEIADAPPVPEDVF